MQGESESLFVGRNGPSASISFQNSCPILPSIISGASFAEPLITLKPIVSGTDSHKPGSVASPSESARGATSSYNQNDHRAKIQMQTMQIDGAIKLLKLQYEVIMSHVRNSNQEAVFSQERQHQERCFSSQFDLARPEWPLAGILPSLNTGLDRAAGLNAAHRKRMSEDISRDEGAKKRMTGSSGKLVLDAEVIL